MLKTILAAASVFGFVVMVAAPASANSCPPQEMQSLEKDLKELGHQIEHAKKDPNRKRAESRVRHLEEIGHSMKQHFEFCKTGHKPKCNPAEVKKLEEEMHFLQEAWHKVQKIRDHKVRNEQRQRIGHEGEAVTRRLHQCKR